LQSLNTASQDSAKAITEKFALTRELNLLKPEVEHLKSQLTHQQSLIAEKLALERQLNSVEVELEAEKRAKHRALQREPAEDEDELRATIQDLERKLAAEKKDKDRVRRECEVTVSESAAEAEMLEQRLDLMKSKLRDTREELKRTQAELNEARSASTTATTISDLTEKTIPIATVPVRKQGKKRRVDEMTTEVTIDTPGAIEQRTKRPLKKRGLEPTLVGEKSNFSITPFLNKTKVIEDTAFNVGDNSVDEEVAKELGKTKTTSNGHHKVFQFAAGSAPGDPTNAELASSKKQRKTPKPRGRPRKVLGDMSVSKKNSLTSPVPTAVGKKASASRDDQTRAMRLDISLEKVVEEAEPAQARGDPENHEKKENEENEENQPATQSTKGVGAVVEKAAGAIRRLKASRDSGDSSTSSNPEPTKKKRKLVGSNKTLFDDVDAEPDPVPLKRQPSKVQLGPAKSLKRVGDAMAVKRDAFAGKTFSPLKRHRRGIHASFLA
jgi:hypothetical protein